MKAEELLPLYQKAINKIDDHFEYAFESYLDKKFVMEVIDELTEEIESLSEV